MRRRNFLRFLFLFEWIWIKKQEGNAIKNVKIKNVKRDGNETEKGYGNKKSEERENIFSLIVGKELKGDEVKLLEEKEFIINLKWIKILPKSIFLFMWKFKPLKKIAKGITSLIHFVFYSNFFYDIGYSGPMRGKADFPRYPDPPFKVSEPKDEYDVLIIGSGAGGGITAYEIVGNAKLGVVEWGPLVEPKDFTEKEDDMIRKIYDFVFDSRMKIVVFKGKCVGGSTVHNTSLFVKLPEKIFYFWKKKGFPISGREFYRLQEEVINLIPVRQIEEYELNMVNRKIMEGMKKERIKFFIPSDGRRDCLKVGFCELGCYWNRKFSSLIRFIPYVLERGGELITGRRVVDFEISYGEVKSAVLSDGRKIKAKHFVLSAGAIETAKIMRKFLGPLTISLHPSVVVYGIFDEDIFGWFGIPISLISDEFLEEDKGFILMPYLPHPATFSASLGGFGVEHRKIMLRYKNIVGILILLHDDASGRISKNFLFSLSERDKKILLDGIKVSVKILFSAGAREVIIPGVDLVILKNDREDFDFSGILNSTHPQATLPFGKFLDDSGRVRNIKNLWIADSSNFPSSCGVPPQLTVMSNALFVARNLKSL